MIFKYVYGFPLEKENVQKWLKFAEEVNTTRNKEFTKMHARIGVTKESWYLKQHNDDFEVLVYTEASDDNFSENFQNDKSDFSDWFKREVGRIQNYNLNEGIKMPKLVLDWIEP
ncbi:MAG: hypothetical protein V7719_12615 [Psychroserpens sp.]|uniref:hypothetical protein n=1 Tax=Psychroserpens sp. TaxID=2020870 RepID=UPI003001F90C